MRSLSEADQKFIGNPNPVPPLAGEAFLNRWGKKTVAQLISRFESTVSDPNFQFKNVDDDSRKITAYALAEQRRQGRRQAIGQGNYIHFLGD